MFFRVKSQFTNVPIDETICTCLDAIYCSCMTPPDNEGLLRNKGSQVQLR